MIYVTVIENPRAQKIVFAFHSNRHRQTAQLETENFFLRTYLRPCRHRASAPRSKHPSEVSASIPSKRSIHGEEERGREREREREKKKVKKYARVARSHIAHFQLFPFWPCIGFRSVVAADERAGVGFKFSQIHYATVCYGGRCTHRAQILVHLLVAGTLKNAGAIHTARMKSLAQASRMCVGTRGKMGNVAK